MGARGVLPRPRRCGLTLMDGEVCRTVKDSEVIGSTLSRLLYKELANLKNHAIKIKN